VLGGGDGGLAAHHRVDQFPDFDPRRHYALTLAPAELSEEERNAAALPAPAVARAGDVHLDLP